MSRFIKANFLFFDILQYEFPAEGPSEIAPLDSEHCYWITAGWVRLLCQNQELKRPVSAALLTSGELIGADHCFYPHPLPYRAAAAAPCQIQRLSFLEIEQLLALHPPLLGYLQQVAQQRSQLIFFKSLTQLRSLSSDLLKRELLPRLVEQRIAPGEPIAPPEPGRQERIWLRSGRLFSPEARTSPSIGDSWGPSESAKTWIADGEVVLYRLALNAWETESWLVYPQP